jgi:competence ComEA-like helix-hairpin-helix protein
VRCTTPSSSAPEPPAPRRSELRIPLVPSTAPARALLWAALALCAVAPLLPPADPPEIEVIGSSEGCALGWAGDGAACPCSELPGPLRRLFGLPIPLNRAAAVDLEALPGIGAVRAQAILEERARGGPFERVDDLVRVRGLAGASVERLRSGLFVHAPDPACAAPYLSRR